jgi:hypothetical protein
MCIYVCVYVCVYDTRIRGRQAVQMHDRYVCVCVCVCVYVCVC